MAEEKIPAPEAGQEKKPPIPGQPEEELEALKERIVKLEAQLEKEGGAEQKERLIKKEIKSYVEEAQQTPSFAAPLEDRDEAKEIIEFEPSQQVGALVSLVFEKGLLKAVSVARSIDNPAVLDEFHDTLIDQYYEKIVEEGHLKKAA